jgi:transcriptional regulator NrdR family protein
MKPRCPWCGSAEVKPCDEVQRAATREDSFRATHECIRCHGRFRHTPAEASCEVHP